MRRLWMLPRKKRQGYKFIYVYQKSRIIVDRCHEMKGGRARLLPRLSKGVSYGLEASYAFVGTLNDVAVKVVCYENGLKLRT